MNYKFIQTETAIAQGYVVNPYVAIIYNGAATGGISATVVFDVEYNGNIYRRTAASANVAVGTELEFTLVE